MTRRSLDEYDEEMLSFDRRVPLLQEGDSTDLVRRAISRQVLLWPLLPTIKKFLLTFCLVLVHAAFRYSSWLPAGLRCRAMLDGKWSFRTIEAWHSSWHNLQCMRRPIAPSHNVHKDLTYSHSTCASSLLD